MIILDEIPFTSYSDVDSAYASFMRNADETSVQRQPNFPAECRR